jgi:hypothetical protein
MTYGSIHNRIQERAVIGAPTPEVGMGATLLYFSDRHAGTITRIFKDRGQDALEVTEDSSRLVSGSKMSEEQEYEFQANPKGKKHYFKKDQNGFWRSMRYRVLHTEYDEEGDVRTETCSKFLSVIDGGPGLRVGERDEYYDPTR